MKKLLSRVKNKIINERGRVFHKFTGSLLPPLSVTIELNYECPLRCRTCQLWTKEFRDLRGKNKVKLSKEEFKDVIKKLAGYGIREIEFCGGEPFLHKDIFELIKEVKAARMSCLTFTNGYLITPERAREIVLSGIDSIGFSIDGAHKEVHDGLKGVDGAYERAIAGIRRIQECKKQLDKNSPDLFIQTTVSSVNFHNLVEITDLAASLKMSAVNFQYLSLVDDDTSRETDSLIGERAVGIHSFGGISPELLLKNSQVEKLDSLLKRLRSGHDHPLRCHIDPIFLKDDRRQIREGIFPMKRCNFFWNLAVISPYGDVFPCPMLTEYVAGNVREMSFEDIWTGERFGKVRKLLTKKILPVCERCCIR